METGTGYLREALRVGEELTGAYMLWLWRVTAPRETVVNLRRGCYSLKTEDVNVELFFSKTKPQCAGFIAPLVC